MGGEGGIFGMGGAVGLCVVVTDFQDLYVPKLPIRAVKSRMLKGKSPVVHYVSNGSASFHVTSGVISGLSGQPTSKCSKVLL
jgi:hypothetical protein